MQSSRIPVYPIVPHGRGRYYPLALGMIHSFARVFKDGKLESALFLAPRWRIMKLVSARNTAPGIWLFSDYLWSIQRNLEISQTIKESDPRNITIHGGPSVPKNAAACERFLSANPHVDIAVRGEGELTCAELLDHLADTWRNNADWRVGVDWINGISFLAERNGVREMIQTPDRARLKDLDLLPSPYLDGTFDRWLSPDMKLATVETNRGCPYGCTFCDWGSATLQKINTFDIQRVKDEITWIAKNGMEILFIADSNFGIFDRDLEIAEHVGEMRRRYGFPREVQVSYAKNGNARIADIVRAMVSAGVYTQGIISIQTADQNALRAVRRTNIRTENYRKLAQVFREQRLPISTDLMIGLPGATIESYKSELQYFWDEDIPVKTYPTMLLPNSPMAEPAYVKEHGIRVDEHDVVVSTATMSEADMREAQDLRHLYELAEKASLLRYILRFLQWEYGIPAMEFLHRLLRQIKAKPEDFPDYLSTYERWGHLDRSLIAVFDDPDTFYASIWRFAPEVLKLPVDTDAAKAVWQLNAAVVPRRGRRYPIEVESHYDFVDYFGNCIAPAPDETRRLRIARPAIRFEVGDPEGYADMDLGKVYLFTNSLRYFELDWPARRVFKSAAFHEAAF
jgi:radical SAM superfamily enzyme YgiQ (UPF0313 family)